MPKGRQGQKRPADTSACAVMVARIATGEIEDDGYVGPYPKSSAGGLARASVLSPAERQRIAMASAEARWNGRRVA
jgi:hypothetical protein